MKDLFEFYEDWPDDLAAVMKKYEEEEWGDYRTCDELRKELNAIGYDCDYGLCGEPFGLHKISES